MESRSLVTTAPGFQLPLASVRSVFHPGDVERKLHKLPDREHENLRSTYERMLERGPDRSVCRIWRPCTRHCPTSPRCWTM